VLQRQGVSELFAECRNSAAGEPQAVKSEIELILHQFGGIRDEDSEDKNRRSRSPQIPVKSLQWEGRNPKVTF
jgi:hypothetical protein